MSERDKIRQQKVLESLAKLGFTVYRDKKVTFAEAELLKAEDIKIAAELRTNKKLSVANDVKNMLNSWSVDEHRLTTFVEAARKCSFMDILKDLVAGKNLTSKQVYTIQELKRNLEYLTQHEEGATTILLPSIAEKLIAGVIVNFYDNSEYLEFTRELLNERENNTLTLMEIYSGKITAKKISDLTLELVEVSLGGLEQESILSINDLTSDNSDNCLAGKDMCNQETEI